MTQYAKNPTKARYLQGDPGPTPLSVLRRYLAHYRTTPALGAAAAIHAAVTLTASPQTVTTAITNPDVPRVLKIVGGALGQDGVVTIHGTDASGNAISESLTSNGTTIVNGTRAFKTVTSIEYPARNAPGDTITVGTLNVLGLPHVLYNAAFVVLKLFNGSTDAGSVAIHAELSKNLYTPAGTLDGAKVLDIVYYA